MANKKPTREQLRRTPKIMEGDETPAGYVGHPGPPSASGGDEAKTVTLDNQPTRPLDPALAGPDAQRAQAEDQQQKQAQQERNEAAHQPQPPADDEHVAPGSSLFSDPTKIKEGD